MWPLDLLLKLTYFVIVYEADLFLVTGSIEVEIHEDSDGYVTIMGHRPMSPKWQKSTKCENFTDRAQQTDKKERGQHR
jgi:hypothetical protein